MRAHEVSPDAPDGPEEERDARRPGLDRQLEQITVGVGKIDAAWKERGRLEAEVDILVRAESDTQHRE